MKRINSLFQAALVLNSLPPAQASQLISRLEPGDIKAVIDTVARLDDNQGNLLEDAVYRLWSETESVARIDRRISLGTLVPAANDSTPSSAGNRPSESPFHFLVDTALDIRCRILEDEHPRHIAMVLSHLTPTDASETMNGFDDWSLRISVLKRMCELGDLDDQEVDQLANALKHRLNRLLQSRESESDGVAKAVKMLSCSDRVSRETMLDRFQQVDPDLAGEIERSVVGLEKLEELDDSSLLMLLRFVDTSHWAPALKNAPIALVERLFRVMASPVVALLQREIDGLGVVDDDLEDSSRRRIIETLLKLERDGKISLQSQRRAA